MTIQTVGVAGAGQMGSGIAHVLVLAGFDVVLMDVSPDKLEAAIAKITAGMARQVTKGKVTEAERTEALNRIRTTIQLCDLGACDLFIEAATEVARPEDGARIL